MPAPQHYPTGHDEHSPAPHPIQTTSERLTTTPTPYQNYAWHMRCPSRLTRVVPITAARGTATKAQESKQRYTPKTNVSKQTTLRLATGTWRADPAKCAKNSQNAPKPSGYLAQHKHHCKGLSGNLMPLTILAVDAPTTANTCCAWPHNTKAIQPTSRLCLDTK